MAKKKYTPKVAIEAPMSAEDLKTLLTGATEDKSKIVTRKENVLPFEISNDDNKWDNPVFTYIGLDGVSFSNDQVLVDGNGKEREFPGGLTMSFNWAAQGIGFGQFRLTKRTSGKIEIDTEGCGKDFFAKALCALVNQAEDSHERLVRRMESRTKKQKIKATKGAIQ